MKRVITLILAILMVVSVLVLASCGNDPAKTEDTKATAATTAESTEATNSTQASETTNNDTPAKEGYTKPDGYLDVTFGGHVFKFITTSDWVDEVGRWCTANEVAVDSREGGTVINTAVYDRNEVMSRLYDCKIVAEEGVAKTLMQNDVMSGTSELDFGTFQGPFFTSGSYLANVLTIGLDFDIDGWNKDYIREASVKDQNGVKKLYAIDGDFNISGFRATWSLCMNLDLYEQNFTESIFDIVASDRWTIDKMIEIVSEVAQDNGDQEWKVGDDTFGLLTTTHNAFGLIACSGLRLSENQDGTLVTSKEIILGNEMSNALDKMVELYGTPGVIYENGYTSNQTEMESGRTLMIGECLDILERMKDNEDINVIVLPEPKYSLEQKGYYSTVNGKGSIYGVSKNACDGDLEMAAKFLSLYAYHSKKIVYPAFLTTYGSIYCQNERAVETLQALIAHRVYDIGYEPGGGYGLISADLMLLQNNSSKAANSWVRKKMQPAIDDFIAKLTECE